MSKNIKILFMNQSDADYMFTRLLTDSFKNVSAKSFSSNYDLNKMQHDIIIYNPKPFTFFKGKANAQQVFNTITATQNNAPIIIFTDQSKKDTGVDGDFEYIHWDYLDKSFGEEGLFTKLEDLGCIPQDY